MALNLSKYARTSPLLEAIFVSPIVELYFKFKYLFLKQIKRNEVVNSIFTELKKRDLKRSSNESFLTQLRELESLSLINEDQREGKDLLSLGKMKF